MMKRTVRAVFVAAMMTTFSYAQNAFIHAKYQNFDFDRSLQKRHAARYIVHFGYKEGESHFEAAYGKTDTETFQPPLPNDLNVKKYYFKYTYAIDDKQAVSFSYATISDNLAKETDGGKIYGVSYRYADMKLSQYISDYRHFNVYQTDVGFTKKYRNGQFGLKAALLGKYIRLQNRKSNGFSAKAKSDYFTACMKLGATYEKWHAGAGVFFGKRIFAVMNNGFGVQHHAMEFDRTYAFSLGKKIGAFDISVEYAYMRATEVPISNRGVEIDGFTIGMRYAF